MRYLTRGKQRGVGGGGVNVKLLRSVMVADSPVSNWIVAVFLSVLVTVAKQGGALRAAAYRRSCSRSSRGR